MIKEAIDRILKLNHANPIEFGGRPYTTHQIYPVTEPTPATLEIHTLTGLADYINQNPDKAAQPEYWVLHIVSPIEVRLHSTIQGQFQARHLYLQSNHEPPEFRFGQFMDIEQFVIELQAKFIQTEATANILALVGNISDTLVKTVVDDGISQEIKVKNGLERLAAVQVPNPVALQPHRTFPEIEQPEGKFVLRLRSANTLPTVALFTAAAGTWELTAIHRIRDWLRERVPAGVTIIA